MREDEIISFRNFMSNQGMKLPTKPIFDETEDDNDDFNLKDDNDDYDVVDNDIEEYQPTFYSEIEKSEQLPIEQSSNELSVKESVKTSENSFYKLYSDISENFSCDIHIDGTDLSKVSARLIIESNDWCILFNGSIQDGKCEIPLKKLDILKEGQTGKIKLEVVADGVVFTPWQDDFQVVRKIKVRF